VHLISPGTENVFCNLPRIPLSTGLHLVSLLHGFPQKHIIKMYPIHSAEYSGEQGMDEKKASTQIKWPSPCLLEQQLRKKTSFCTVTYFLHSCQHTYFELTAFTRHHFHYTSTHIRKMCRSEPQRGRRSKHKARDIFMYLSVFSLHLPL